VEKRENFIFCIFAQKEERKKKEKTMQKRLKKKVEILVENRDKTKTLKSIVTMNNTIQDGLKKLLIETSRT